jgi:hypothetical protein
VSRARREGATLDAAGEPDHEAAPTGVRSGCLLAGALFVLGAFAVIVIVALQARGGGRVSLGTLEEVEAGTAVYYATDHVFVVRLAGGDVLVLSDLDPHNPPGRRSCRVTFRPDLEPDAGGRFFDACTGSTYNLAGIGSQGDGLDLERIEFEISDDGGLSIRSGDAARTPVHFGGGAAL